MIALIHCWLLYKNDLNVVMTEESRERGEGVSERKGDKRESNVFSYNQISEGEFIVSAILVISKKSLS